MSVAIGTTTAGPLALSVTAILKDVLLTYAGFIVFDDSRATIPVVVGITFSFVGAILCIYTKYNTIKTKTEAKNDDSSKSKKD